jgi:4-oxalocrotonate tautomerase
MPIIEVHAIRNVFSNQQKKAVIEKLTDAMVELEGEKMRGVTWVTFHEVDEGAWGIGGRVLTANDVKAILHS